MSARHLKRLQALDEAWPKLYEKQRRGLLDFGIVDGGARKCVFGWLATPHFSPVSRYLVRFKGRHTFNNTGAIDMVLLAHYLGITRYWAYMLFGGKAHGDAVRRRRVLRGLIKEQKRRLAA